MCWKGSVSVNDDEISFFSNIYDMEVNAMILVEHLNIDDSLTRFTQFARMPFHNSFGG